MLDHLPRLVEEHDRHGLGIISDGEGSSRRHRHEEEFVEDLPPAQISRHGAKDVYPRSEIGGQKEKKVHLPVEGQKQSSEPEDQPPSQADHVLPGKRHSAFVVAMHGCVAHGGTPVQK